MKAFFDASALVKRYVVEAGTREVDALLQGVDELGLCSICVPEIISALNRRIREKSISRAEYTAVKGQLLEDVRDAVIVNVTDEVVAIAIEVMEKNSVRAMDALHIAAAKAWKADLFVSGDKVQVTAANHSGLKCKIV